MAENAKDIPPCFKLREEAGHPVSLDVQLLNGDRYALPYSYLIWIKYDPSDGILIRFSSYSVHVKGRNLGKLYDGLREHRAVYVRAEDPRYDTGAESQPFINHIEVKEPERQ